MRAFAAIAIFSVLVITTNAQNEYVEPGSVNCISTGINFRLTTNTSKSDLAKETGLNIDLDTSGKPVTTGLPGNNTVTILYADFQITATTAYGPNKIPVLYNVDQRFFAYPKPGVASKRNYTFDITCIIPATYNVNITTNTTDDGHGDHGGGTVEPKDHVEAKLSGLRPDGSSTLGDKLTYVIDLKDNVYAALMPLSCKYFDPSDTKSNIPFVLNGCPQHFPDDPDGYFGTITQVDFGRYALNFRAFSFSTEPNAFLGIDCDVLLCINDNKNNCTKTCWGNEIGTTAVPGTTPEGTTPQGTTPQGTTPQGTTPQGTTAEVTTPQGTTPQGTTPEVTTPEVTTPEATTPQVTTPEATTPEVTTPEATTPVVTTPEVTTPQATTPEVTTPEVTAPEVTTPAVRKRRFALNFNYDLNSELERSVGDKDDPVSVSINEKTIFKINNPGSDYDKNPVCENSQLLTALYGIIGGLAILVVTLLLTLVYLLWIGRRRKVEQEMYPMVPDGPRQPY